MKKILSVILSLAMVLTILPLNFLQANAVDATPPIIGTLSVHNVPDMLEGGFSFAILTLDSPCSFDISGMDGGVFTADNVKEIQISLDNYTDAMDGKKIKVTSYDDIFQGHTRYHVRDFVMLGAVAEIVETEKPIKVTLNGEEVMFDQPPVAIDGRTLVPIRAVIEKMGGTVDWDGASNTATLTYSGDVIKLILGSNIAYLNGVANTLDVAPCAMNNRTLLPIRFVAESFNHNVDWDGISRTVIITRK